MAPWSVVLVTLLVGALVGGGRWMLGRWRAADRTLRALETVARARGAQVHATARSLRVVGTADGRPFTVAWHTDLLRGHVLLVAVDGPTAASTRPPLPGAEPRADGTLACRLRPPNGLDPSELEAIIDAMAEVAASAEATSDAEG